FLEQFLLFLESPNELGLLVELFDLRVSKALCGPSHAVHDVFRLGQLGNLQLHSLQLLLKCGSRGISGIAHAGHRTISTAECVSRSLSHRRFTLSLATLPVV